VLVLLSVWRDCTSICLSGLIVGLVVVDRELEELWRCTSGPKANAEIISTAKEPFTHRNTGFEGDLKSINDLSLDDPQMCK